MSISDLHPSGEHVNNMAQFAAILNLARVDGTINPHEEKSLKRFANKLDISDEEYKTVSKNPDKFPLEAIYGSDERLERLYDLFMIIYSDNHIDESEQKLVLKYAIALGYKNDEALRIIQRSIRLFGGEIDLEDYQYLIKK